MESKLRDIGGGRLCDKANKFGLDTLSSRHGDSWAGLSVRREQWAWKSGESFRAREGSWCPSAVQKGGSACAGDGLEESSELRAEPWPALPSGSPQRKRGPSVCI